MRGIVDFDFLVMSVHRLLHVAKRARTLGCDTTGELALPIRVFKSRWKDDLSVTHKGGMQGNRASRILTITAADANSMALDAYWLPVGSGVTAQPVIGR